MASATADPTHRVTEWLAALIKAGWLDEAEAENRAVVADAIEDILDCYSRGVLSPDPGRAHNPHPRAM